MSTYHMPLITSNISIEADSWANKLLSEDKRSHYVAITTYESYIPTTLSLEELQH